ncbi:hypothetical protein [Clostridium sp. BJN0001]|uniref:hypothetical protein n=1 Tax=Clostridium sp. BJN0001 TaxID=2930219 RepID=UPI001FD3DE18|nr:hypothetical protein [Clostridium sp. BJN0001]
MNISEEQKEKLLKYGINASNYNSIDELLEEIDDEIVCRGLTKDQEYLNKDGLILQKLYDEIYNN